MFWKISNMDIEKYVSLKRLSILEFYEYLEVSRLINEQTAKKK